MRLNEVAQHTWDVTVAALMLTLLSGGLGFTLGLTAKPEALSEPTEVAAGDWALVLDQSARLVPAGTNPVATFTGTTESFHRLLGGRLAERWTPAGTEVTGASRSTTCAGCFGLLARPRPARSGSRAMGS